jgi:membrane associated rhomboid family serine protease
MIIIPTEKRFDWQHAPLILFSIVVLNTLVFFLYQSGDSAKFQQAWMLYDQNRFIEFEWPAFRDYLSKHDRLDEVKENQSYLDQMQEANVAVDLLMDRGFYQYLLANKQSLIPTEQYESWLADRGQIDNIIASMSHNAFGLIPNELKPISLITYQFLHGGIMHLLGNMFFLVICGFAVEAAIGHFRFLIFYLLTGVVAGISHAGLDFSSMTALIGASGAVSGVMAMYLGIFRFKKIEFFYWFFIFVGYFRLQALFILPLYIGKELFSFYFENGSNVAFMAHAGGFVAGVVLIGGLLLFKRNLLDEEYIEQDQDDNPFQEKLAKVYRNFEQFRFDQALSTLDVIIAEWGLNFELAALRYNLMKATKSEGFQQAVIDLLSMKRLTATELKKLERVWRENPAVRQNMDRDELINLGMRFSNIDHIKTAESIFMQLQNDSSSSQSIAVLAQKLALVHGQLQNRDKQRQYEELAKTLSGGVA